MTDIDPDPNYTGRWDLSTFVNRAYGDTWIAEASDLRGLGGKEQAQLPRLISQTLADGVFILALVEIVSGSSRNGEGGRVGETPSGKGILHWVVISAMSAEWDYEVQSSCLNWVRVFNPFDNQIEYYAWEDFAAAWSAAHSDYRMVLVSRK
jgi:hypothetical protein